MNELPRLAINWSPMATHEVLALWDFIAATTGTGLATGQLREIDRVFRARGFARIRQSVGRRVGSFSDGARDDCSSYCIEMVRGEGHAWVPELSRLPAC
jgi:uncharacterized phage protein gp47/JayE